MFTFSLFYIFVYYQLLTVLYLFFCYYVNIKTLTQLNISTILLFINNYTSHSVKFFILPLLLSGLPPVSFFFIKFAFLINVFSTVSFTVSFLLFINFLLGMLFYLQFFNITKTYTVNKKILLLSNNDSFNILEKQKQHYTTKLYQFWMLYTTVIFFNLFSIIFFFDFFIIMQACAY